MSIITAAATIRRRIEKQQRALIASTDGKSIDDELIVQLSGAANRAVPYCGAK